MTPSSPPNPPAIPVTVIGGYLGAGKTTLVNHVLRQADGLRIAVLVNDFGELPIDADLIEGQDDNVINIAGGCVCCSFGSDLISTLMYLYDLAVRPDHLLIEASGVALPHAIAESVSLLQGFKLESTVVLADAETVRQRSLQTYFADTITRQLSCADLIVLNKCDLVEADKLSETEVWLKTSFQSAALLRAQRARIPLGLLTGRCGITEVGIARANSKELPVSQHPDYVTTVLEFPDGVDPTLIAQQLAREDAGLLRSKGHIKAADGLCYTVQTVGRRPEVSRFTDDTASIGKLVLIAPEWRVDPAILAQDLGGRVQSG